MDISRTTFPTFQSQQVNPHKWTAPNTKASPTGTQHASPGWQTGAKAGHHINKHI